MDAGVEAELVKCCNRTICTYWICCNDRDHRRWLIGIACQKNLPLFITAHADGGITRYDRGGGLGCITVGGDQE